MRPEQSLIPLLGELDVYANLRPTLDGDVDLLSVRDLVGGLYVGASGRRPDGSAYDTCEYSPAQIERIVRRGFELAQGRRRQLASADKANVMETSRLWREIATSLAPEYPDVELRHVLADTAGLLLARDPAKFDVIVTENTFGDLLSDVAAGATGGLGLAASASLGDDGPGLFEPVHGSAPGAAAHSAAGAEKLFPGSELVPLGTFVDVVRAVLNGECGLGVLPIESSLAGPVAETHDLLWEHELSIVAETSIPIKHLLVARQPLALGDVRVVRSHPMGLEQCRELLARLPGAEPIATSTTAAAAP